MKGKVLLILFILLTLTACAPQSESLSLEDLTNEFEERGVHLIPQMDSDYPILHNVMPKAYELTDASLYIYLFESQKDIEKGFSELKEAFPNAVKTFTLKNALLVYIVSSPLNQNYESEIEEIVKTLSKK